MPIIGPQVAEIRPLIDCMSDPSEWRNLMGNTNGASLVKDSIRKYKHLASQPSSRTAGTKALTRIKVVGLGDSGCKWVHRMYSRDLAGVEYVMVNTEVRRPKEGVGLVEVVKIEPEAIDSWGTGWYPEVAELALGESDLQLRRALEGTALVLLTGGMGGRTATRAAPYVGTQAKEMGAFVIGVVSTPFSFEGSRRIGEAVAGIGRLRPVVDNLIVVHGDRLLRYVGKDAGIAEVFEKADEVITQGIVGLSQLLNPRDSSGADFEDVRAVLEYPGGSLLSIGLGRGPIGALDAARQALEYPLLNLSLTTARGILLLVKGGDDLPLGRVDAVGSLVAKTVRTTPNLVLGTAIEHALEDRVELTLIATGL